MVRRRDPPVVRAKYDYLVLANSCRQLFPPPKPRCLREERLSKIFLGSGGGGGWSRERVVFGPGDIEEQFQEFRSRKLKEMEELREAKKEKKELKKIKREKKELKRIKREKKELKRMEKEVKAEKKRKAKVTVKTEVDEDEVPLKKLKLDEVEVDANQGRNLMKEGLRLCAREARKRDVDDSKNC